MTTKRRRLIASIVAIFTIVAIALLATGASSRGSLATALGYGKNATAKDRIHYYAHEDAHSYNFGPTAYKSDDPDAVWIVNDAGQVVGDFSERLYHDPALVAAVATDITGRNEAAWSTILGKRAAEFKAKRVGERPDALHLAFLQDEAYWDEVRGNILDFFKKGSATVSELKEYTSSMYMLDRALDDDKPSVVVRKSSNTGGHFLWFNLKDQGVYGYRLECGYQPVDVEVYWPAPPSPPVPDNPTPTPTPTTTTTTLKPKDPNAGPQAQTGGKNADYGGGANKSNDTKLTPEPTSPRTYTSPSAPTAKTTRPATTATPQTSAKPATTKVDNKTYDIVTGNDQSKDFQPLDEVQQNPPAVEPALNPGTNSEAISAPE